MPMDVPTETGPFVVKRRVGVGAHGEVWEAEGPEGTVALKIASSDRARQTILREARLLEQIDHRYVVKLVGVDPDGKWLALENVDGATVDIWGKGQPVHIVVDFLARLAEGLGILHQSDIVHGDLKPANVLVDRSRYPRLIDLGVSGLDEAALRGGFHGTLGYAAPEQLRGLDPPPASDLYALGVLAYQLTTGQPPFPPPIGNVVRLFLKVCSKPRNFKMLRLTVGWNRRPPL